METSVDDYDPETELTYTLDALKNKDQSLRSFSPDTIKSYPSPSTESSSSLGLSRLDLDETKTNSNQSDLDQTPTDGKSDAQGNNVDHAVKEKSRKRKLHYISSHFTQPIPNLMFS